MPTEKLVRLSGLAAVLCGLATVIFWLIHPLAADPKAPHDAAFFEALQGARFPAVFLLFVALLLLSLVALVGYYCRLHRVGGLVGLCGFLLSLGGTAMFIASGVFQCGVAPVLAGSAATRGLLAPDGPLLGGLLGMLFADPPVPYEEVAERLGVRIGTIGPTRIRCLERLRRQPALAGWGGAR